ncbi:MAG TPA: SDR family NAD(P)-dependent oxidoreductase [Candidatus Pullilachnospira gallistercoris]|uniref:SDR family NAD(P)-dependent oxidoreductase n=1 Tax=Candidatus Pullilachnospira gallistercoris TaxID=2840911 RepID=A0A9D1JAB8_9FIRM|nr:SDR family NAD(P)-dependent oxidoreductase [Candidatus Pullilachnospira gallistercoris]
MADVCVITGGGSGMGLAAAKYMPKEKILVLAGRTEAKLQRAIEELKAEGHEAYAKACDTSKRESVRVLAEYAASLGEVKNVINSAGLSPNMAEAETILRVNALGTVYMNEEFSKVMKAGSVIVDVASNSAYVLPGFLISKKVYALADQDERLFLQKMLKKCRMAKEGYARNGMAYAFSKNFVVWYAKKCAFAYGKKGIRVVSLSPGLIATDMGNLEKEEGGSLIPLTAEERMGKPEELGFALATVADERNGYLAGVDVLCDGGSVSGKEFKKKRK